METTHAIPRRRRSGRRLQVVVVEGPDAGEAATVDSALLVGTSEVCDLQLTDRTVSRRHVRIEPGTSGLRVVDLESRNGTWLDDTVLHDAEVGPGVVLSLGSTRIAVEEATGDAARDGEPAPGRARYGRFVGQADVLQPLYSLVDRAASTDLTVLLEGESGTGKELLAEAIHEHSPRAEGPFVVIDCGAMPENLIESELMGHERGAFTGADRAREGAFERASGGTVFLDEIGELPVELQTRLLRVLDRRVIRRVGSSVARPVDVRVIAATNRNLDREVEHARFRLDLFHRLAVVVLRVPPLREREEDLALLSRHFADDLAGDVQPVLTALERVRGYAWPGNVRELRHWVERLLLVGDGSVSASAVPAADPFAHSTRSGLPYRQARAEALQAFTQAYVEDMLARHEGNVSQAARAAGIARRHFQRLKQRERDEG